MEELNRISLIGLLAVLTFSIAVTADEVAPTSVRTAETVADEQEVNTILSKEQLRERYVHLDRRTILGKITDKRAYE